MEHLASIIEKLGADILAKKDTSPLVINISGCMGSGKTTWATALVEWFKLKGLPVTHVSEDDFLQPRPFRADLKQVVYQSGEWEGKTQWEVHENWLRLDLMKQVILNLKANAVSKYHPYLRETGTFSNDEKVVEPAEIVVFETSIFNELFDVVVLVEVEEGKLLERKLSRDNDLRKQETIREYHEIAQWPYWQRYRPQKPDYVIDNNEMLEPKLRIK